MASRDLSPTHNAASLAPQADCSTARRLPVLERAQRLAESAPLGHWTNTKEGELLWEMVEELRRIKDVEKLMIRWRIVAQRWTPGGSEYMDPRYCEDFIRDRRLEAHRTKVEAVRLRQALERIARGETPPDEHGHYLAHREAVRIAREALGSAGNTSPLTSEASSEAHAAQVEQPFREDQ